MFHEEDTTLEGKVPQMQTGGFIKGMVYRSQVNKQGGAQNRQPTRAYSGDKHLTSFGDRITNLHLKPTLLMSYCSSFIPVKPMRLQGQKFGLAVSMDIVGRFLSCVMTPYCQTWHNSQTGGWQS